MNRPFLPLLVSAVLAGGLSCSSPAGTPEPKGAKQKVRECAVTLSYAGADPVEAVVGEFTNWQETPLEDGQLVLEDLEPGHYAYAFVVDGEPEAAPPASVPSKWFEGKEYRNLTVPDCEVPTLEMTELEVSEDGTISGRIAFVAAAGGAPIDPEALTLTIGGEPVEPSVDRDAGHITFEYAAPEFGKYSIRVRAADAEGVATENELWIPVWYEEDAFSWQDATMYLAFTDRFRDTDAKGASELENVEPIAGFMGGDFPGVTQAIEEGYFDELGVNALWLSPVYENPEAGYVGLDGNHHYTGYHGYWPIDPLAAEETYGGDEALHALIEAAHARGIRVIFDVVLNHVHEDHGYCTENPAWCATTCVCGSENCAWEGENGRPLDCQFAPYLPDLNYRNHELVERVLDDVEALARKFDVDGFRVDAAKHMDHVIMRTMRARFDALEAQGAAPFYLVGETFTGDRNLIMNYVSDHELHGQFDFPLFYAIRGAFAHGGSFRDLEAAAAESQRRYGAHYPWMSPFLGNHDIPRFATEAMGNDQGPFGQTPDVMETGSAEMITQWDLINRMSMAFAFLLTQPGVPLIYYGDEVGLAGSGDPDNRRMMPTALSVDRLELLRRVQELGKLRREVYALRHGNRKEIWLDDSFYVYVRDAGDGRTAVVAMNKGNETRTATVELPSALGLANATLESRLSEREFQVIDGQFRLSLDPWEYVVLTPATK